MAFTPAFFAILFGYVLLPFPLTRYCHLIGFIGYSTTIILIILFLFLFTAPVVLLVLSTMSLSNRTFVVIFLFRYIRLVVNFTAFYLYKAVSVSTHPKLTMKDMTVIVPTTEGFGNHLEECIRSVQTTRPASIIVVTAGPETYGRAFKSVGMYPSVIIKHCNVHNKRRQVCLGLQKVGIGGGTGYRSEGNCGPIPPFPNPSSPKSFFICLASHNVLCYG